MRQEVGKNLVFVLFDGIKNSVFQSQVLAPLMGMLDAHSTIQITLVSFEQKRPSDKDLISIIPAHERLHCVISRRTPFVGKNGLKIASYQFGKLLAITQPDELIARGPLAGFVLLHAMRQLVGWQKRHGNASVAMPKITIQARGLCAEEYRYDRSFKRKSLLKSWLYKIVYGRLESIERDVFGTKFGLKDVVVEAVSPALKDYLIEQFQADPRLITIASKDIPQTLAQPTVVQWRAEVRSQLGIPSDAIVYCYSGSFKPWQCAPQTVQFFVERLRVEPKSFLLVLSGDHEIFAQELVKAQVPTDHFRVLSVKAAELYRYLAAADFGLLFRERDVINWVSRPTKMLEYQAVGLPVLHNNTIAILEKDERNVSSLQLCKRCQISSNISKESCCARSCSVPLSNCVSG
ncbi:hypothetical protein IPF37_03645 [bacterium]|nr:MAG: hypothetical protein IPF37_03645 [bacterium]